MRAVGIKFDKFLRTYGMPLCLLVLVVLLQIVFNCVPLFSLLNIKHILLETVSIAMTALGLSYIMISGEGDLSFAGVFSLLTVIFALVSNLSNSFILSFLAVMAIAVATNFSIAGLVTRFGFSSFIVSIAVMFMANGVEKALHQQTTLISNPLILSFATVEFGLPLVVWLLIMVYFVSYVVINKTRFGFSMRIVGENKNAAIEAGINSKAMKVSAYLIAAFLIALASSVESTRVGAIYEQGKFYMLPVFAACYLGSSMFVPGRINVIGTLVGALFLAIIEKFMHMINVESFIVSITQGAILILAVGLVAFKNRAKIVQIKL
jgi:ribose/xylose/arabinose/galactoside ABC-type transport system permease subunit